MKYRGWLTALAFLAGFSLFAFGCSQGEDHEAGHMGQGGMEGQQEMMGGEHAGEMAEHDTMMGEQGEAPDEHGVAMENQHQSMIDLQEEWMKAKAAMSGGDTAGAAAAASEMEKSAAVQDQFMLHRHAESKQEFERESMEFRRMVMGFKTDAEKGDIKSLREVAPKIDAACNTCHGTFR